LAAAGGLAAAAVVATQASAATGVPAPESVLGFVPGEDRKLVGWGQVLDYVQALDAASGRLSVEEVGKTTEGRPFVIVTVTSAANHARLQEIRQANARLADPRGLADEEAERLLRDGKAIVAMAYSIHSTEVGGTLAALRLLHRLAASDDEGVRAMLDATVLLVIPSHNPDGTDLVREWYEQQLGTPFEGTTPPRLYHRYVGHDNNRDWYMFTQQETLLTLRHLYHRWHPQIVHDAHQMGARGARLFVPPFTDPWEPNVDPALTAAVGALGSHVASRLLTAGRTGVVTGALFDAWTPARAYPHTHGGVRFLSETASARIASPIEVKLQELEARAPEYDPRRASANFPAPWPGGAWRLADIVETQLQASLAVLEHAAQNREHWLRTALAVNRRAVARREPFAFLIPAEQRDPAAARRLASVLQLGEVELERAQAPFDAGGRRHPAGTLVVRLQQPASGFAKALLEAQRYPDRREYAGGPPRAPYDVTAHTLPLLLGVEVEAVAAPFEAQLAPAGERPFEPGRIEGRGPRYALAHSSGDLVALGRLLANGVEARWALDPFEDGGHSYPAGSLVVHGSARRSLEPLAAELGIVARSVRSQPRSLSLRTPRVGLYRSWVPSMDEGWTRFVFEKEMGVAYQTLVDSDVRIGRLAERFDAIVLPDQSAAALRSGHAKGAMPEEYTGGLGVAGAAALAAFVEAGGTLVALDSASGYAIEALGLRVKDALAGVDPKTFYCPGSILRASVDTALPLAHGLAPALPLWFEGSPAFEVERGTVLARYDDADPLLSGWLLGGERLRGRAALVETTLGKGRVVLFGFRPQYRAQSRASYVALVNALYLSAARP
jgi:Zinc carboxypeptidase